MRILFDLSFIRLNPYAGVSKYAYRILDYIVKEKQCDKFILIINTVAEKLIKEKYPQFESITIGNHLLSKIPIIRTLWCTWEFRHVVNKTKANLLFCPWGNEITCLKNHVVTISVIHDLQVILDIHDFRKRVYKKIFSLIFDNSDIIVTISEFSKKQIYSLFPEYKKEIYNLGNSVSFPSDIPDLQIYSCKYILYVGRICKMKNIKTLVRAYGISKDKFSDYKLLIVGNKNEYWEQEIAPLVTKYNIASQIEIISNCDETTLFNLYRNASLFVFPSLREGFGSPPIEAAIMKTPVICTKCDSLSEVTKGLLYTYDNPLDANELSKLMHAVLFNPPSEETLETIRKIFLNYYSVDVFGGRIISFLIKHGENK